jgi:hypothetical protein
LVSSWIKGANVASHEVLIIATLARASLLVVIAGSLSAQTTAPRDVVVQFCTLDAKGEQLTSGGRQQMQNMFAAPGTPKYDKVEVIADFAVSRPFPEKSRIGFVVDYTPIGWIDVSHLRFYALPRTLEVRGELFVIRAPVQGSISGATQGGESSEWRIEGEMPPPHVTIAAAIRYVEGLHSNTSDGAIKKRTEQLLASLNHIREREK